MCFSMLISSVNIKSDNWSVVSLPQHEQQDFTSDQIYQNYTHKSHLRRLFVINSNFKSVKGDILCVHVIWCTTQIFKPNFFFLLQKSAVLKITEIICNAFE